MCVSPTHVWVAVGPSYEKQEVPCRKCWACLHNRVTDFTGRALCELATSDWAVALTLTYDDALCEWTQPLAIHKHDFQRFMKKVRKAGYKCRYLCAGEYGEKHGRAHFHVVLFGVGMPPKIANLTQGAHWEPWEWGNVWADWNVHEGTMRYVAKYLVKSMKRKAQKKDGEPSFEWVTYSRQPLLGAAFIIEAALRQAASRVFPYTFAYVPPGANRKYRYSFRGAAENLYFDVLLANWPEAVYAPKTEWMENAFRRYVRWRLAEDERFLNRNYALHVVAYRYWSQSEAVRTQDSVDYWRAIVDAFYSQHGAAIKRDWELTQLWLKERETLALEARRLGSRKLRGGRA